MWGRTFVRSFGLTALFKKNLAVEAGARCGGESSKMKKGASFFFLLLLGRRRRRETTRGAAVGLRKVGGAS